MTALPELIANSPQPGVKTALTTLNGAISTTPAAGTVETWTFTSATNLVALGLSLFGQYHFVVDNEILIDTTAGGGVTRTIVRGAEGSTPATHITGSSVLVDLTKESLLNLIAQQQGQPDPSAARAYLAGAQTLGAGAFTKILLDTKTGAGFDPSGSFDLTNHRYVCKTAGYYQVDGAVSVNATGASQTLGSFIYRNGSVWAGGSTAMWTGAGAQTLLSVVSDVVYCAAGDYIELWGFCTNAFLINTGTNTYFSVVLVNPSASNQPSITPPGAFQAHTSAGAQLGAALGQTKVALNTVDFDASGAFSTANNRFQPTQAGYYQVTGGVSSNGVALADGDVVYIFIEKNGSTLPNGVGVTEIQVGGGVFVETFQVSALVFLNGTTDYVELWGGCEHAAVTQSTTAFIGYMQGFMAIPPRTTPNNAPGTFNAHGAATQLGAAAAFAKVPLATIDYDLSGYFSTANSRFQPTQAGYYQVNAGVLGPNALVDGDLVSIALYKGGPTQLPGGAGQASGESAATAGVLNVSVGALVFLNGTTDYLELWGGCITTGGAQVAATFTGWMNGFMVTCPINATSPTNPVVTTLPSSPVDGQECDYLADATNGVVWHLKYRAADPTAHKWQFVGGPGLYATVAATESTASTTYAALTTAGPTCTVPLAGDYDIEIGAYVRGNTFTASSLMSFDTNSGAVDSVSVQMDVASVNLGESLARVVRIVGFNAAVAVTSKYRTSAGTASFGNRYMRVTPVRVG